MKIHAFMPFVGINTEKINRLYEKTESPGDSVFYLSLFFLPIRFNRASRVLSRNGVGMLRDFISANVREILPRLILNVFSTSVVTRFNDFPPKKFIVSNAYSNSIMSVFLAFMFIFN